MGPSLIFDKSVLQALNQDEAMWLDNFYLANVTPMFFIEVLADLEKEVKKGRTPEDVVGNLADKTPGDGCVNVHYRDLLAGELMGQGIVCMDGRPCAAGGRSVKLGNETGVIFQPSPEVEAFQRWQKRQFLDVERTIAKKWREDLKDMQSEDEADETKALRQFLDAFGKPKSLEELKKLVEVIIDNDDMREETLLFGIGLLGVSAEFQQKVIERWRASGMKSIKEFAPYFRHVFSVDLFFRLGALAGLFLQFPHAETQWVDIAYLHYLPFCKIFVSNDKFHLGVVPHFLTSDQRLITGADLKTDLLKLDRYYSGYPDEVKARGVMIFAFTPPDDKDFLVTNLWDKYMSPGWRNLRTKKFDGTDVVDSQKEEEVMNKVKSFIKQSVPAEKSDLASSDDADQIAMHRMVFARRGKWTKFPPQVLKSKRRILEE